MDDIDRDECRYWEGVAGDDLAIPIQLLDTYGEPVDLTGATDIVAEFTNNVGTIVQMKLSANQVAIVTALQGRAMINVPAATSVSLATDAVRKQTFDVYTVQGGKQTTWVFNKMLLLKPRPVPAS